VTHIGSGFASEIEYSLDILLDLVEHHTRQMAPFAVFVKVRGAFCSGYLIYRLQDSQFGISAVNHPFPGIFKVL